ncbi:MAG: DNA double-strand break repair nuclease NurA [Candidatus Nanoarchaeia archaeon]|nr:DNA double-strand break repair nuclease NurA [Candidatus Nanoarchaeia archaeon]
MEYNSLIEFISKNKEHKDIPCLEIKEFLQNTSKSNIYAVDGGNAVIIDGGTWIISKVRTAVVLYNKNRVNESHTSYIVANTENAVKSEPEEEIALPKKIEISEIPNHFRKIMEVEECIKSVEKAEKDDIVLCDFLFIPDNVVIALKINELIKKAEKKGVVVVGIGKTSRANIKGNSLIGFLNSMNQNKKSLWYSILEPASNYTDLVAKLYPLSKYTYRINTNSKDIENTLGILSYYSSDTAIPGYPYPLIRADWLARITDNEKHLEKTEIGKNKDYRKLSMDERSMDFHERLDEHAHK